MKSIARWAILTFLILACWIVKNSISAETGSPEDAFKQLVTFGERKEWGPVFDCYDQESQEILLAMTAPEYFAKGAAKIPPREMYIKKMNSRKYIDISPEQKRCTITGIETKGDVTELTVKYGNGIETKCPMKKVQGKWKVHFGRESEEYRTAQYMRETFSNLPEPDSQERKARDALDTVKSHLANNETDLALGAAEKIDPRFPYRNQSLMLVINRYIEMKDYEKAFQTAETQIGMKDLMNMKKIAAAFADHDQLDRALKISAAFPNEIARSEINAAIAGRCLNRGQYDAALKVTNLIINPHVKAGALAELAGYQLNKGQYAAAFELARQIDGGRQSSAGLAAAIQRFQEACLFDQALALTEKFDSPDTKAPALAKLAGGYFKRGRKAEGMDMISRALQETSKTQYTEGPLGNIIDTCIEHGFIEKAIEAAKHYPDTPYKNYQWMHIAAQMVKMGNEAGAIALLDEQIKDAAERTSFKVEIGIDPGKNSQGKPVQRTANDYFTEGERRIRLGQIKESADAFSKAVQMDPRNAKAYAYRAIAYYNMGKTSDALSDCDRATQLDARLADAYFMRARIYYDRQEYEKSWDDIHMGKTVGWDENTENGLREQIRPHVSKASIAKYENAAWKEFQAKMVLQTYFYTLEQYIKYRDHAVPESLIALANEVPPMLEKDLIEGKPERIDYRFDYKKTGVKDYEIHAVPLVNGMTQFYVDYSGKMRKNGSDGEVLTDLRNKNRDFEEGIR